MSTMQAAPGASARPGPQWRTKVAVVLAVVIAGVLAVQWWVTTDTFRPYSTMPIMETDGPLSIGETVVVPVGGVPTRNDVVLRTAVPRVEADGLAYVEVVACTSLPGYGVGRVESMCRNPTPIEGVRLRGGPHRYELALVVHSISATRIEVSGVDVAYRAGLQSGRQHTAERFVVDYATTG